MTVVLYKLDPASESVYQEHARRGTRLLDEVDGALEQGAKETATHLQANYLRGGNPAIKRDGKAPLANRSNALIRSVDGELIGRWQAVVGAIRNVPKHAKVLLGSETWKIVPKVSKYLWIPIGKNRSAQGGAKTSPREARAARGPRGGRLLSIFKSKNNNLIAFLRDPSGGTISRGKNKGRQRGRLLFVLKESVEVKGTDALAQSVEDRRPRNRALIQIGVNNALGGA